MAHKKHWSLFLVGILVLSMFSSASVVTAAATTDLTVSPTAGQDIQSGETTTYDVVLGEVDNGIGAWNFTISLSNGSVATITNASTASAIDGDLVEETIANDGSAVTFAGTNLADGFADSDFVLAKITVEGDQTGATGIEASANFLSDADNNAYDLTLTGSSVTVNGGLDEQRPPTFSVRSLSSPSSVVRGQEHDISATIENTGGQDGTQSVRFQVDGGTVSSKSTTLAPEETTSLSFTLDTATMAEGSHTLSIVTANETATSPLTINVPSNEAPNAEFETTPSAPNPGETISLDAGDSSDPDGHITDYRWDFGIDGTIDATGQTVSTSFTETGTHNIELHVEDDDGAKGSAIHSVSVEAADEPPVPRFNDPGTVKAGETIHLDGTDSSAVKQRTIESYGWTFGDGSTATGGEVSHTYDGSGTYDITLTVTDSEGQTDTLTKSITVEANPAPTIKSVVPEKEGATLEGIELQQTFTAQVQSEDPIDRVVFKVEGPAMTKTFTDYNGDDGWAQSLDLSLLSGDATVTATAYDTDGQTGVASGQIKVVGIPDWMQSLQYAGEVEIDTDDQGGTNITIKKSYPSEPVDINVDAPVPVVGGEQSFYFSSEFGVVYQMQPGEATLLGSGRLKAKVMGKSAKGEVGAKGTVKTPPPQWKFVEGEAYVGAGVSVVDKEWDFTPDAISWAGELEASVEVTPNARTTIYFKNEDGEVVIDKGKLSPGLNAEGSIEGSVSSAVTATGTVTGDLTGHITVPELKSQAEATLTATATVEFGRLSKEFTKTYGPRSTSFGQSTYVTHTSSESEWVVRDKYGSSTPAMQSLSGPPFAATFDERGKNFTVGRITHDQVKDSQPSVVYANSNYTAIWSRQDPNNTVQEGHEIYLSSSSKGANWTQPTRITTNQRYDADPSLDVNPKNGSQFAAWVQIDKQDSDVETPTPEAMLSSMEIVTAQRSMAEGNWSEPVALTNNTVTDTNPVVSQSGDKYLVAWIQDIDGNLSTKADRQIQYVVYDGEFSSVNTISDASALAVNSATADGEAIFRLTYVRPGTTSEAEDAVVSGEITTTENPSFVEEAHHNSPTIRDVSTTDSTFAWVSGPINDTSVFYANSTSSGSVTEISTPNVTEIRRVTLFESSGTPVLAYQGTPQAASRSQIRYTRLAEDEWLPSRTLAGENDPDLTYWQADHAVGPSGFTSVFAGQNISQNQYNDLFAVHHSPLADLAVNTSVVENRSDLTVGSSITIEYSVRNIGDTPVSNGSSVGLRNQTGRIRTNNLERLGVGESVNGTFNAVVDDTGQFTLQTDPANSVPELLNTNNDVTVQAIVPDLSIGNVSERTQEENVTTQIEIKNTGSASISNVSYRLTHDNRTLGKGIVPYLDDTDRTHIRITVPKEQIDPTASTQVIVSGPTGTTETNLQNNKQRIGLLRPDIGLHPGTLVAYQAQGDATRISFLASNSEPGDAVVSLQVRSAGNETARYELPINGSEKSGDRLFEPISVVVPQQLANTSVGVIATTDPRDKAPLDNAFTRQIQEIESQTNVSVSSLGILDVNPIRTNGTSAVQVTVQNPGNSTAGEVLELRQNGSMVAKKGVAVPGGNTYTIELGTNGHTGTMEVTSVDDSMSLTVEPGPTPLPSASNRPQDPDGDGLYEDINGDDDVDARDVLLLWNQFDSLSEKNKRHLNFDGVNGVDARDVLRLWNDLKSY